MPDNTFSISMNSYSCGSFDLAECLEQIAQTPIRCLELPVEQTRAGSLIPEIMVDEPLGGDWRHSVADLKSFLADGGFTATSIAVFGAFTCAKARDMVRTRIDFAEQLGVRTIVFGSRQRADDEEDRRTLYALLRDMADYALPKGITICLEIHGGVTANASAMRQTLAEVDRPNVGVNFDTANILFYNPECDPAAELAALAEHVRSVHVKDIVPGKTAREHVLPRLGQGVVDFPRVFETLNDAGFAGPFCLEVETFHGATVSDSIADYQKDVLVSIDYLRSIGKMA